ncbi:ankyrin and het domain-containing protein [Colletotrichum truncatum]|uniref:Ankyrin and het domain-containing protein n=1 Tax=Colletotrichum truncatum TaxID=5467 RepID=A0ACC3YWR1_COLTU|nr:ankyrin and het domain-containing protein [Colletotrichum truncatum]KAF6787549.1 ankyrin and het domain-containing protein [Colletotrichum truncatum]
MSSPPLPVGSAKGSSNESDIREYEFQIALDQLVGGSTEALKVYLARQEGLDPATVTLRSGPWQASEGSELTFIGKMDNVGPPGEVKDSGFETSKPAPHVALEDTGVPYKYTPLDPDCRQFRLLKLGSPDENGITSQFRLETYSIDDSPSYFCLSYVWGDPARFLSINCDGEMISVTQNLFHALQTCFTRHPDSWLWADGICINQEDVAERSSQVLLMGTIYQHASMVLAHPGHYSYKQVNNRESLDNRLEELGRQDMMSFGVDETDNQGALTQAQNPHGVPEFTGISVSNAYSSENAQGAISIMTLLRRIWSGRDHEKTDKEWENVGLPTLDTQEGEEIWGNLLEFWSQDWYFRTWVLQEVVLAAKVVVLYGSTAISLEAITEFWSLARQRSLPRVLRIGPCADIFNKVLHLSPVSSYKTLRDRRYPDDQEDDGTDTRQAAPSTPSTPSLFELLCLARNNLATDPRDKVYSLLGLTNDGIAQSIIPDYSPENTVADVFTGVANKLVSDNVLDILHYAGIDQDVLGLPSWVPDWTRQSRSTLPTHLYQCMSKTTPKFTIIETDNKPKLKIRGAIISRVNQVGAAWKYYSHNRTDLPFGGFKNAPEVEIPPFNDEDSRNFILSMASQMEEGLAENYSKEGFNDALVRTLAVDCSKTGERIGPRVVLKSAEAPNTVQLLESTETEQPPSTVSHEFFDGVDAFRRFYARGPDSEDDLVAPGIRVHQTAIFMWLLDFDEEVEADLQKRMVAYTVPVQEAQRGRRFATLGTRVKRDTNEKSGKKKLLDTKELETHFMGTLPWNAEVEDYVVVLEGFKTPFVLRKCNQDTGNGEVEGFQLIGDCYVHGIMDGELLQLADQVDEQLASEYFGSNNEGQRYAVRAPQGFVPFTDLTLY